MLSGFSIFFLLRLDCPGFFCFGLRFLQESKSYFKHAATSLVVAVADKPVVASPNNNL